MDQIEIHKTKREDCYKRYLQSLIKIKFFNSLMTDFGKSKILDYGAGVGSFVSACADILPEANIHGYEPSIVSVDQGLELYNNLNKHNFSSELADSGYEIILCQFVYKYVSDKADFFHACHSLLSENGKLILEVSKISIFDMLFRNHLRDRFAGWEVYEKDFNNLFFLEKEIKSPVTNLEFEDIGITNFHTAIKALIINLLRICGDCDSKVLIFKKL